MTIRCILFDLDGTLVDTAPDLGLALNLVLQEEGREPLDAATIRPHASQGGRGLLKLGFGIDEDHADYHPLRERFLAHYQANICVGSKVFEGINPLLAELESRGIGWGVVTNKPIWLTRPLMAALTFPSEPLCVVGADQVPRPKPDPAAIELACEISGLNPEQCLYVGDAERDIVAGQRAGMQTIAVRYGYIEDHDSADHWDADWVVDTPAEILGCLVAEAA